MKTGVLLVNTGSSSAPTVPATRAYLKQFLSDPRIIDIPGWKRWLLVNGIILRFRPAKTAEAYREIWTDRGSPLIAISEDFRDALAAKSPDLEFQLGMAYGEPSIPSGIEALMAKYVDRIIVAPLFPQYASATTGSVLECVYKYAAEKWNVPVLSVLPPFYSDEGYLSAWEAVSRPVLDAFNPDHVLLSFHGLPVRQIYKGDPSQKHCLLSEDCCEVDTPANRFCYRKHCLTTARELARRLGLNPENHTVAFQSRLGRDEWLSPATSDTVVDLAHRGVKRLAILSPAFVADCLETIEELGMQARDSFLAGGGKDFTLVPSLNTHSSWVKAFTTLIARL